MKKTYGITLKTKSGTIKPVPMSLSSTDGSRVVLNTAKRIISTHEKVIKALANR